MLAENKGEFLVKSTHSEKPSLPHKLADDVISLSGSAGGLGDAFCLSVGHARFEFILPLPTAADVSVLGDEVLVSVLAAWEISLQSDKTRHSSTLMNYQ